MRLHHLRLEARCSFLQTATPCRKRPFPSTRFLCLSRACLGKMIAFSIEMAPKGISRTVCGAPHSPVQACRPARSSSQGRCSRPHHHYRCPRHPDIHAASPCQDHLDVHHHHRRRVERVAAVGVVVGGWCRLRSRSCRSCPVATLPRRRCGWRTCIKQTHTHPCQKRCE